MGFSGIYVNLHLFLLFFLLDVPDFFKTCYCEPFFPYTVTSANILF